MRESEAIYGGNILLLSLLALIISFSANESLLYIHNRVRPLTNKGDVNGAAGSKEHVANICLKDIKDVIFVQEISGRTRQGFPDSSSKRANKDINVLAEEKVCVYVQAREGSSPTRKVRKKVASLLGSREGLSSDVYFREDIREGLYKARDMT